MKTIYRVVMLNPQTGRWDLWTNYAAYDEAELAACGLVSGGKAVECHILEIGADGGRIAAKVGAKPAPGFPHGQVVVKRAGDINAPAK
jgi:hypothetical protein